MNEHLNLFRVTRIDNNGSFKSCLAITLRSFYDPGHRPLFSGL
jgi:hypothetical protein